MNIPEAKDSKERQTRLPEH